MKMAKQLLLLAATFCLLGPALLFLEKAVITADAAQQALPIALLATFFFSLTLLELGIADRLRRTKSSMITGFYLTMKVVRILLSAIILVVYAYFVKQNLTAFAINLAAFYIVTMIFVTRISMKAETKNKKVKS